MPSPKAHAEDDGVLLSVVLDIGKDTSFLLVLDTATLEELARARAPHAIPFHFHGNYFQGAIAQITDITSPGAIPAALALSRDSQPHVQAPGVYELGHGEIDKCETRK